ncbi:hypothetical protein B0H17DRAFT_210715 [Mycena rosella]|uniref:DUF7730 domain-containing protein n=1 Tax=Mycena rosella TaxID=1033263 RepID=A0AAD7DWI8_MYCRO|nr:hypothetical protein B0H17DRAFT_210715 [Mycena rosella]
MWTTPGPRLDGVAARGPPPALPTSRIEIHQGTLVQSPSCRLLRLPAELRKRIYEVALGGHVISSSVAVFLPCRHFVARLASYESLDCGADAIATTLLLSCRQVYLEALPVLYRHNTLHVYVPNLEAVVRTAMGQHCLSDLRSLHLCHKYYGPSSEIFDSDAPLWTAVFTLLKQMQIYCLVVDFQLFQVDWTSLDSHRVLDSVWSRGVLELRNLRRFEVSFKFKEVENPERLLMWSNTVQALRHLMIGPGADERY